MSTATAAEPAATSVAPESGDGVVENSHTSVPVIAGVSAVAVLALTACLVLLAIVWKKGVLNPCLRTRHASPSPEENHVEHTDHEAYRSREKDLLQELSAGEAHVHELDGTTIASPGGLDEDKMSARRSPSDVHAQSGPADGGQNETGDGIFVNSVN